MLEELNAGNETWKGPVATTICPAGKVFPAAGVTTYASSDTGALSAVDGLVVSTDLEVFTGQ